MSFESIKKLIKPKKKKQQKHKKSFMVRLHGGKAFDWYSLTRRERREMERRIPGIVEKIKAAEAAERETANGKKS